MLNEGNETSSALPNYEDIVYRQTNISDLTISTTSTNFTKWASTKMINIVKNTAFGLAFNLAGLNREVKDKIFAKHVKRACLLKAAKAKAYPKL